MTNKKLKEESWHAGNLVSQILLSK